MSMPLTLARGHSDADTFPVRRRLASLGGKWLELLTEIAPGVKRATIMFNPDTAPYARSYYLPSFEAAARSFKVAPIVAPVHSEAEIETVITSLGSEPGGGLVVMPDTFVESRRAHTILLAARNNVPTVYPDSVWARDGGLLSYGPNRADIIRRSAENSETSTRTKTSEEGSDSRRYDRPVDHKALLGICD
jgi:hypothetical protein